MFQAFRIYDFIKSDENSDFYGVFVDRLYPRGVKKEIFCSFLWLKSVTPSNELRSWFHEDKNSSADFIARGGQIPAPIHSFKN